MPILGIYNRTENWKTAFNFSPFFRDEASRLKLVERLGEPGGTESGDVHIELFWKGMRDHLKKTKKMEREPNKLYFPCLAELYERLFPDLRQKTKEFRSGELALRVEEDWNYRASTEWVDKLGNNLVGTEIDVVLETPKHLFIGEAKHQSGFGASGDYVLVHQLIRQYVMAKILVALPGYEKEVVPFIVRDSSEGREQVQVDFMLKQGWLKKENILSWDGVKELWP